MSDLPAVIRDLVDVFETLGLPYAIMGGIAVRAHGIPRPTYDVDFTLSIPRGRLHDLFTAIEGRGYTIPEQFSRGWVDTVGGMPLIKVRLFLEGRGVDADIFLAETALKLLWLRAGPARVCKTLSAPPHPHNTVPHSRAHRDGGRGANFVGEASISGRSAAPIP